MCELVIGMKVQLKVGRLGLLSSMVITALLDSCMEAMQHVEMTRLTGMDGYQGLGAMQVWVNGWTQ